MSSVLARIPQFEFPPRYGPEWGSGGIFGMKYHRGTLIYTLAFEAEVHIQGEDKEEIYRFEHVGGAPRSGGDTYNAVEAVDDNLYFGGWVHAPAVYQGRTGKGGTILFNNKFSHLHSYDTRERKVNLLWRDTLAHREKWAGEVSQIVYDPVGDRLLIARADGHEHLGVYSVDRRSGEATRISDTPALKGTHYLDYVCFDVRRDWTKGLEGIQTLDVVTGKWTTTSLKFEDISLDGGGTLWPSAGCAISAYSRLFFFVRGGVLMGDPLGDLEGMRFARMFDFGTDYSPARTVSKAVGGGVLVAFNAYSQSFLHPRNELERGLKARANFINGPSVLIYITPPQARIVGALGGRITSFEKIGGELLVAASGEANLSADDAVPIDAGNKDLTIFRLGDLLSNKPPVVFRIKGEHVMDGNWGGFPLDGYHESELQIDSTKENTLTVSEYDLGLPPLNGRNENLKVKEGRRTISLSGYHGIVSFRLEQPDPEALMTVRLS